MKCRGWSLYERLALRSLQGMNALTELRPTDSRGTRQGHQTLPRLGESLCFCSLKISLLLLASPLQASAAEAGIEADGWTGVAPREEIRPSFEFKPDAGPGRHGILVIRAEGREGLDGHWTKTLPIKGGKYYRFRVLRRVENVPSPRRSALARILWRDAQGRPVRHEEPGAKSYAPNEMPV